MLEVSGQCKIKSSVHKHYILADEVFFPINVQVTNSETIIHEQISKWIMDGRNQISHGLSGRLQIRKKEDLEWSLCYLTQV